MALRWGIASAGRICHDFVTAMETLEKGEHELVAVATAKDLDRAKDFAKMHDIKRAYGSYKQLSEDPDVEIVYVGNLHNQHYDVSLMMLEKGKHVLCEKPMCMNQAQAKKLMEVAQRKKLFLMEAIWSRFYPSYQYIKKQIDDDKLGEIKEVHSTFGLSLMEWERLQQKELAGSSIMDLGVYPIQIALWCFREAPIEIHAQGELNKHGVDIEVTATLIFSRNRRATIMSSTKRLLDNNCRIVGTRGTISMDNFWCPTKITDVDGTVKEWPLPKGRYEVNNINSIGLRYEAQAVKETIRAGKTQNENVPHTETLRLSHIQDEIRRQVGVVFAEDSKFR